MGRLTQLRHATLGPMQTRVAIRAPHQVTRVGPESTSTLELGPIWTDVMALYQTGLHPAIGLTIRHRGRVVLDRTIGHVHHEPGHSPGPVATPNTPFNLFSASKILTALVVHALVEDGLMDGIVEVALATQTKVRLQQH